MRKALAGQNPEAAVEALVKDNSKANAKATSEIGKEKAESRWLETERKRMETERQQVEVEHQRKRVEAEHRWKAEQNRPKYGGPLMTGMHNGYDEG